MYCCFHAFQWTYLMNYVVEWMYGMWILRKSNNINLNLAPKFYDSTNAIKRWTADQFWYLLLFIFFIQFGCYFLGTNNNEDILSISYITTWMIINVQKDQRQLIIMGNFINVPFYNMVSQYRVKGPNLNSTQNFNY